MHTDSAMSHYKQYKVFAVCKPPLQWLHRPSVPRHLKFKVDLAQTTCTNTSHLCPTSVPYRLHLSSTAALVIPATWVFHTQQSSFSCHSHKVSDCVAKRRQGCDISPHQFDITIMQALRTRRPCTKKPILCTRRPIMLQQRNGNHFIQKIIVQKCEIKKNECIMWISHI